MPFTVLICVCDSRKFHRSTGQGKESQNLRCFTARFACVGAEVFSGSRYAAYACGSNFVRRLPVSLLCESEIIEGGATEIAGRKLAERDHRGAVDRVHHEQGVALHASDGDAVGGT